MEKKLIEILDKNEADLNANDLKYLLELCQKHPDFKVPHLLLRKFPSDIFNIEHWNSAEVSFLNNKELHQSYQNQLNIYAADNENELAKINFSNLKDKLGYQQNILTKFLAENQW